MKLSNKKFSDQKKISLEDLVGTNGKDYLKGKKLESYMRRARVVAEDSHDAETQVGAVLVHGKTGAVLASGYNGFIRGADDENLPNTRPEKYPYMVHAEVNLIYNCARHGVTTQDCFLVVTLSPCVNCLRAVYQCGITEVYFDEKYRDFDKNCNMQDLDLELTPVGKYTRIDLRPKRLKE